jgi:alkanesulfonate monooxygenase
VKVFSTCPSSLDSGGPDYLNRAIEVARWSEAAGCTGILVYTDNSLADPWLVSQCVIQNTRSLSPLVAVQPAYMHPYSVAKIVSTLAFLHGRRICLNMVAGGFKADLVALNDTTPHDSRYKRLVEYTHIVQRLIEGGKPLTFEGEFYKVSGLALRPAVPPELRPEFLMSGSSDAGLAAAQETGSTAIKYPEPPDQTKSVPHTEGPAGVRIGIIARPQNGDAWDVALARFPETRAGQLTRQLATKVSDSAWHHRLSEIGKDAPVERETYWLQPFENYHTNCPYLVGSYQETATELASYIGLGFRTFILDIPASEEEFRHIGAVFQMAARSAGL